MELSKTSVCQEMDLNFEKKMPPFNGEKKKSHGLTYVDKQLIRLKRSNFSVVFYQFLATEQLQYLYMH